MTDLDPRTLVNIARAQTVRGIPPTQALTLQRTLTELLAMRVAQMPNKVWLIHYDDEHRGARRPYTYREFSQQVNQVAHFMQSELGLRHGDCVATIAHNHVDVLLIYFAAWQLGAIVAPQNIAEDDQRIAYILRNSQTRVVFVMPIYMERAQRIVPTVPTAERVIEISRTWAAQLTNPANNAATSLLTNSVVDRNDNCLLVYTSGTTGAPKGVMLTHYNLLVNALSQTRWDKITSDDRLMTVLPIHHVNGLVVTTIAPLTVGASVVLNRQFSASHFWQRIAAEGVTISSVVPTILQFLLEADLTPGPSPIKRGETLRYLICGAGTLSVALAQKFEERFSIKIIHGYGLSETTAYACHLPVDLTPEEHRHWLTAYGYPSIGCALDVNELAIFDVNGEGHALAAGERGEIAIRGHNVMKGYFQRTDANRETFKYGWFRSGDEGFYQVDEQGRKFFFITGRIKELINRGGVKFSPFDIEEVLGEIPGVRVGLAIAFEHKYYGEEVGAYVVVETGMHLSEENVLDYCRKKLGFEKSPKVVVFGQDVPVTATGKYQRLMLREKFVAWQETQFRR